ncbi:MAG: GNAT family N-acetyltransferase [Alphaproteobacteria bacterium]
MNLRPFEPQDAEAWDALVDAAPGATFLHARRFLAYHGARFRDASLVFENRERIVAVIPAAVDPGDPSHVVSHPGATYGGLVAPNFSAGDTIAAFDALVGHYRGAGFSRLTYKTVPLHLTALPSQADRYALWRLGAEVTRRDLWSVVWTDPRDDHVGSPGDGRARRQRERHARRSRVAERSGLEIFEDASDEAYHRFHMLLSANLQERHGVKPVHTVSEMIDLRDRLGDSVRLAFVAPEGRRHDPVAGVWTFRFARVAWHTQYIAANAEGREKHATYVILRHLLDEARDQGVAALSYGAVTEQKGKVLNPGLERFKSDFGGGLVIHDFYTLPLGPR